VSSTSSGSSSGLSAEANDEHNQAPHSLKRKRTANNATSDVHVQVEREPRIVGGTSIRTDKYPYFVRVDNAMNGARGICGANLVAPDIVLTAGHCLKQKLKVVVNGYNRSRKRLKRQRGRLVESSRRHPLYNGTTWEYDYLLLKLKTKVDFAPIPLNRNNTIPETGDDLIAVGMGQQTEGGNLSFTIREVTIPAADPTACFEAYQQIERQVVRNTMLCAGDVEKSPCKGDSGGPLLSAGVNKTLVGLVSWGAGCGRKNFPTVFSRISGAQEWLTSNICQMSDFPPTWCPPPPSPTPASVVSTSVASRRPTVQVLAKTAKRPTLAAAKTSPTVAAVVKTTSRPTVKGATISTAASRAPTVRGVPATSLTETTARPTGKEATEPTLVPARLVVEPPTSKPIGKETTEPTLVPTPLPVEPAPTFEINQQ
jgi:trypsin